MVPGLQEAGVRGQDARGGALRNPRRRSRRTRGSQADRGKQVPGERDRIHPGPSPGDLPPGGSLPRRGTLAGTPGACGNGNRGGTQGQHDARGEAWHPPGEAAHPAGGRLPPAGVHTRRETGMLHRCPARRGGLGSALDDPPRARHRRGTGPRGRGGRSHVGMVAAPVQP